MTNSDFDISDLFSDATSSDSEDLIEPILINRVDDDFKEEEILFNPEKSHKFCIRVFENYERIRKVKFPHNYPILIFPIESFIGCSSLVEVNIPKSVISLDVRCFSGCKMLKKVEFDPNSELSNIRNLAFYECESLKAISFPKSLEYVGTKAFSKSGLACLDFSSNESIKFNDSVFKDCRSLVTVIMPPNLICISNSLFENCSSLKSITFPNLETLENIEEKAFYCCSSLTRFNFSDSIEKIDNFAFSMSGLVEVELKSRQNPKNVIFEEDSHFCEISMCCFKECLALETVKIGKNILMIRESAFESCQSLKNVIFEEDSALFEISESCFRNTGIESISIPSSVLKIGSYAFYKSKLRNVFIPRDSLMKSIGEYSFYCGIGEFVIPKNVESIGKQAFSPVTKVSFGINRYLAQSESKVIYSRSLRRIISVPEGLKYLILPETIEKINFELLRNTELKWINIPASVKKIFTTDLMPYVGIKRITFSKNSKLIEIGCWTFRSSPITRIEIPSNVEELGKSVFMESDLKRIIFPTDCKIIVFPNQFLSRCYIVRIDIPASVEIIMCNAFNSNDYLEIINFPPNSRLKKILDHAFDYCERIRSINLFNCSQLETIAPNAFSESVLESLGIKTFISMNIDEDGCLTYYDRDVSIFCIPDNVKSIKKCIFIHKGIENIVFNQSSSLKVIGKCSFSYSYTYIIGKDFIINFPPSLEIIKEYAFFGFRSTLKITFMKGSKLKRIKKFAFANVESIKSIELPPHEVIIEKGAFEDSEELLSSFNVKWEDEEEESTPIKGETLYFDSETIVIPSNVTVIYDIKNKKPTENIEFDVGSKLIEIQNLMDASNGLDLKLPSTVEKIHYNAFKMLKRLSISSNNIKTNESGVVISIYPRAILFVPPQLEFIDIDPELEVIHSYAFYKSKIKSIFLPQTMKIIGIGAFYDSDLEHIDFCEGTELDILDSYSLFALNLNNFKFPIVKQWTGNSILRKCQNIEFPQNYGPKRSGIILPLTDYICNHVITIPISSYESIFTNGCHYSCFEKNIIYD